MDSKTQKILTTDGIPLEESLRKAEKKNKIKAFLLVAPLLFFLIITYIFPIGEMFTRSIDDRMITNMLPKTFKSMEKDKKELAELEKRNFEEMGWWERNQAENRQRMLKMVLDQQERIIAKKGEELELAKAEAGLETKAEEKAAKIKEEQLKEIQRKHSVNRLLEREAELEEKIKNIKTAAAREVEESALAKVRLQLEEAKVIDADRERFLAQL